MAEWEKLILPPKPGFRPKKWDLGLVKHFRFGKDDRKYKTKFKKKKGTWYYSFKRRG